MMADSFIFGTGSRFFGKDKNPFFDFGTDRQSNFETAAAGGQFLLMKNKNSRNSMEFGKFVTIVLHFRIFGFLWERSGVSNVHYLLFPPLGNGILIRMDHP